MFVSCVSDAISDRFLIDGLLLCVIGDRFLVVDLLFLEVGVKVFVVEYKPSCWCQSFPLHSVALVLSSCRCRSFQLHSIAFLGLKQCSGAVWVGFCFCCCDSQCFDRRRLRSVVGAFGLKSGVQDFISFELLTWWVNCWAWTNLLSCLGHYRLDFGLRLVYCDCRAIIGWTLGYCILVGIYLGCI